MLVYPTSISNRAEPIGMEPRTDEPDRGSCWNCGHMCECKMLGLTRTICARRRDAGEGNELEHITMPIFGCTDWVHFEQRHG